MVCETQAFRPDPGLPAAIKVCVLEDIVAEKPRALSQQKKRNRQRHQDVFDIARILRLHGASLDRRKVTDYLLRKAANRDIVPTVAAFVDPEIKSRAVYGYETLFSKSEPDFVPFEEAWLSLLGLVAELGLPP